MHRRQFAAELKGVVDRKNLAIVLADPKSLPVAEYGVLDEFDKLTLNNTSLMFLWDGDPASIEDEAKRVFPIKSALKAPAYLGAIANATSLDDQLDITLAQLRNATTSIEAKAKAVTDSGPTQISGSSGG